MPESSASGELDLVISGLPLSNLGVGLGVYTYRLILGLLRRAPELRFRVVVPERLELPPEIPAHRLVRLKGPESLLHPMLTFLYWGARILRYAHELPPTTLFHSPAPIAGFHRAPRTLVTIHDCLYRAFPQYYGRSGVRKWHLLATERFAAKSTLVLTQSAFSRRDLARCTPISESRIRVLAPWVDETFLRPVDPAAVADLRMRLRLPEHFWLYIGGFDLRKNVGFLIDAYAAARSRRCLPPLVLAGRIPESGEAVMIDVRAALRRNNLSELDVLTPGYISVADLPQLYRAASLLIYPSLMEGFGLPVAEAIAVGTPVLTANNSSLPEVVGRKGCLFDATQPDSLIGALLAASEDETQFQARLSPDFTEANGVAHYLEFLREAMLLPAARS